MDSDLALWFVINAGCAGALQSFGVIADRLVCRRGTGATPAP
jgi:hypothetical protein